MRALPQYYFITTRLYGILLNSQIKMKDILMYVPVFVILQLILALACPLWKVQLKPDWMLNLMSTCLICWCNIARHGDINTLTSLNVLPYTYYYCLLMLIIPSTLSECYKHTAMNAHEQYKWSILLNMLLNNNTII